MIAYTPSNTRAKKLIVMDEAERRWFESLNGAPEWALIDWSRQLLLQRDEYHRVFLDVGAHCGTWALNLAETASHVFAWEPQRRSFFRLAGGIVLNDHLESRITAFHEGVDQGGQDFTFRTLAIINEDGGGSSFERVTPAHHIPIRTEEVVCGSIDSRMESYEFYGRVGLIKVDVEGLEVEVIEGAKYVLKRHRPHLLIESWSAKRDVESAAREVRLVDRLVELDYRVVRVTGYPEMILGEPL